MKLLPPHHPPTPGKNAMDGTWCRVGGQGWGPLEFQVGELTIFLPKKEKERGGLRNQAACQQGGVLSLFHEHTAI